MRKSLQLLMVLLMPAIIFAQGITTSAISGKIVDQNGNAMPGVNVVAVHDPSGSKYGTVSREDGNYNVTNIRPGGPYTLKVSMVGYSEQSRAGIYADLGQNVKLNFTLSEGAVEVGEVVVTGQGSPILSSDNMGAAAVVGTKQMDALPSLTRNFEDYYKFSPYMSGSNAVGRNRGYNNIQIDGANYNDLFGLGGTTPGSQSRATPISLDAIEQFQIEISPYDVRKGGFTGSGINAITRSGTNKLAGSAFLYTRNEANVGKKVSLVDSLKTAYAKFSDNIMGFRVGGPIIENKMYFFANAEMSRNTTPLNRVFGATSLSTNQFTIAEDSLEQVKSILQNKYGYDAGGYASMDNILNSDKWFARFDWNISDEHRLTVRHNYLGADYDNSPSRGRGAADIFFTNGRYTVKNATNSTAFNLKSVFGNDLANEFIVGYTVQEDRPVHYGAKFPSIYVETKATDGKAYVILAGAEQYRHRNELDQKVLEISDNLTYYMGDHTISLGARMESFEFRNLFIHSNFGVYRFATIKDLELGKVKSKSYAYNYALKTENNPTGDNNYAITWNAITYGGWLQDEWLVNSQLKLNGGVRFDMYTYPDKPAYNKLVDSTFGLLGYDIATNKVPDNYMQVSPRFGFNYDVTGDRSTQIRGGYGIFSGRVPYVWISNQYGNTGVEYAALTGTPTAFVADPLNQPGPGTAGLTAGTTYEIDITSSDFKNPSVSRMSFAIDQQLPFNFVATVEGIFTKAINEIGYANINLNNGKDQIKVVDTINAENRFRYGSKLNSKFKSVIYLFNTDKGYQNNFSFSLNRSNAEDKIDFIGGYTWGESKDINSGASATAFSQFRFNPVSGDPNTAIETFSSWDRTHRVFGSLSYTYDWAQDMSTQISMFYEGQSGRGFSYIVSGDVNGDGASNNDLVYIPKDASDIQLVATATGAVLPTTNAAYTNMMAFIDADEYLKGRKGKFAERNGAREPWANQLDLRVTQTLPVPAVGGKLELYLNVMNVLNLLNDQNGWIKQVPNQNVYLFRTGAFTAATNKMTYIWSGLKNDDIYIPSDLGSRWQMQLGMRYTF
ncbi:MAG: carboxypeptidase regulatory-like domain-containing protein [Bacteroidetes bacterium]|nr:carboxypeptidase regulatory-like domain-containing protein [Bacteroidota bacterium]